MCRTYSVHRWGALLLAVFRGIDKVELEGRLEDKSSGGKILKFFFLKKKKKDCKVYSSSLKVYGIFLKHAKKFL